MSYPLEILDQLMAGPMQLSTLLNIGDDHQALQLAVKGLLESGAVALLDANEKAVPNWRRQELIRGGDL